MANTPEYHRVYNRNRYHQKRKELIDLLGGKCATCGSTDELQFDHIDPSTKEIPIGQLLNFSRARIMEEAKCCQVLCSKCHAQKTKRDYSHPQQKLGSGDVIEIRRLYASGLCTQHQIAKRFGISQMHVSDICTRKCWSEV